MRIGFGILFIVLAGGSFAQSTDDKYQGTHTGALLLVVACALAVAAGLCFVGLRKGPKE